MADIIKIKAKKNFEWSQQTKYVSLKIPMVGHNSINNVKIFLSDLILRITSLQKNKSVETLDLAHEVDYMSSSNKFVMVNGVVHCTLKKMEERQWATLLVEDMLLADLKVRRKQSEARYEESMKKIEQNKEKLKYEHDRMATKQLMRFEEEQHRKLEKKKQQEKTAALNEVFRNIDDRTGKIQYEGHNWDLKGKKALQLLEKQQEQQRLREQTQKKKIRERKYVEELEKEVERPTQKKQITMFTEEEIRQYEEIKKNVDENEEMEIEEIPVRKQGKVNLKFTEKVYPHVAARQSHLSDPPMPKGGVLMPPNQGDLENRNPLWLKDRGDKFFHDKNYSAAIDAYTEALKVDNSQTKILMNRSLAYLKTFNLDLSINDCDTALLHMQKQLLNSQQENKQESLLDLAKIKTRKALCLAWKGKLKQSKQILVEQLSEYPLSEQIRAQINSCIRGINSREESLQNKVRGDEYVKRELYLEAIGQYNQAIAIDNNQYAISNKCLCLNKVEQYEESMRLADEGIKALEEFGIKVHSDNASIHGESTNLLLKLLYRKAKSQESTKKLKQAEQTLTRALNINPQDMDIKSALKSLKQKENTEQYYQLKQSAKECIKNNKAQQALSIYSKCLKLLEKESLASITQQYLSVLQNQCVCYLKMENYDSIIAVSIRILGIVNNAKSKIAEFGDGGKAKMSKEEIDKILVRTLVRRANAYLKTGQVYNAKADLEKAVEVDPKDANVGRELEKLKSSLGVSQSTA